MRRPAISPDGQWIAFEYQGDLFKVPAKGGRAIALTSTSAYENNPVWSRDGSKIAFASDQYGDFDVYVMSADGGPAKRLTFNSAKDVPLAFNNDDQNVLFGTARNDIYTSVRFPIPSLFMKLYRVPVKGGRSVMINSAGMDHISLSADGTTIIFQNRKGYESPQRKHEHASVTPDIWTYNLKTNKYKQLTTYNGDNLEPVWDKNGVYYFLSDRGGNLNVYKASVNSSTKPEAITHFKKNPVRGLSIANDGTLAFAQGGEIYTKTPDSKPESVNITISADFAHQATKILPVNNKHITEMAVSPDSAEIAFVYRGNIFVTSTSGETTKQLTDTPYQERMIAFGPKGHTLYYSVEKDDFNWDIYKITIANKDEPYFYAATVTKTKPVVATKHDEFQPVISPDGKKMAYLQDRNILKVYNMKTGKTVTVIPKGVNYSYSDGDQYYSWSPDSRWILATSGEGTAGMFVGRSEIDLIRADGSGQRINLTKSGFGNHRPKWILDGKAMIWATGRNGLKNMNRGGQGDVYAMFFDKKAYDRFELNKQELRLKKKEQKQEGKDEKEEKKGQKVEKLHLNLKNLRDRTRRLTLNSSRLSDYLMSKDGKKLYYLANYDGKYNLWVTRPRTHKTKVLARLNSHKGGSLAFSADGKKIFVLAGGRISKVDATTGKVKPVKIDAQMKLDAAGERAYILGHAWQQVRKKLLYANLHGVDWNDYYHYYKQFLPYLSNNYDFCNMLSEFLGELNVSHTGCRFHPHFDHPDQTASLGMLYDLKQGGSGLVVKVIIPEGPMDRAGAKVKPNDVLKAINGTKITAGFDWAKLLNHKADVYTRLTFHDPKTGKTWDEVIKPISKDKERKLLYKRWTNIMKAKADSISGGKIGYVHVRGMNERSYRHVFGRVLGENMNKQALVVDTRFNGGGWLHDKLATFLSGKLYLKFAPQGHVLPGGGSLTRWDKPSDVLISQSNYSDAFIFPFIYKELGIGKLVGMPVPGTGSAVWWETQIDPTLVFGIPMVATEVPGSNQFTENHQLEPDIKVRAPYSKILHGKDPQLKAAVQYLMKITSSKK
jgi:Tol biopolymer transport system component